MTEDNFAVCCDSHFVVVSTLIAFIIYHYAFTCGISVTSVTICVCYQKDSGQFCCLLLFSLCSGKHFNFIYDYDVTVLFKRIQDRRKKYAEKTLK